jgi:hypothetical protein
VDLRQERWLGLPEVNRQVAVHWLAVITVKAVITPQVPTPPTEPGWGE